MWPMINTMYCTSQDHQNNPFSCTMQQITALLNCLVMHKETNMKELYEQGQHSIAYLWTDPTDVH